LVSCSPDTVDAVLAIFRRQGFEAAAVVGRVLPAQGQPLRVVA
jgi:selenide,water dikinase